MPAANQIKTNFIHAIEMSPTRNWKWAPSNRKSIANEQLKGGSIVDRIISEAKDYFQIIGRWKPLQANISIFLGKVNNFLRRMVSPLDKNVWKYVILYPLHYHRWRKLDFFQIVVNIFLVWPCHHHPNKP